MGVFWDHTDEPPADVVSSFKEALEATPPAGAALQREAGERALAVTRSTGASKLNVGRLAGAIVLVLLLAGAGVAAEAADLSESSKALFGFATTVFGVVVGLLTGEKGK